MLTDIITLLTGCNFLKTHKWLYPTANLVSKRHSNTFRYRCTLEESVIQHSTDRARKEKTEFILEASLRLHIFTFQKENLLIVHAILRYICITPAILLKRAIEFKIDLSMGLSFECNSIKDGLFFGSSGRTGFYSDCFTLPLHWKCGNKTFVFVPDITEQ